MPTQPKKTNVKGSHKNFASKISMNAPRGGASGPPGRETSEEQDPKRRIGQHNDAGTPPLMEK